MFQKHIADKFFNFRNFISKIRAFYEIICKNNIEHDRPQMTTRSMRIACRIQEAANTHSEYVVLTAFLLQKWLNELASMLHCYVHGLSCS